jgi:colanic acid/amylovoran biosynthesis glycosyltransferase
MKYSLQNQVFFLDGLDRNQVLIDSKIHVMPTFLEGNSIEGFGISNVEAAAYGLPCIVSTSGGTPESIIQNQTGFIVKEKNVDDLYKAMKDLIMNKNQYERFSSESLIFAKGFLKEKKIIEYLNSL